MILAIFRTIWYLPKNNVNTLQSAKFCKPVVGIILHKFFISSSEFKSFTKWKSANVFLRSKYSLFLSQFDSLYHKNVLNFIQFISKTIFFYQLFMIIIERFDIYVCWPTITKTKWSKSWLAREEKKRWGLNDILLFYNLWFKASRDIYRY